MKIITKLTSDQNEPKKNNLIENKLSMIIEEVDEIRVEHKQHPKTKEKHSIILCNGRYIFART